MRFLKLIHYPINRLDKLLIYIARDLNEKRNKKLVRQLWECKVKLKDSKYRKG